MVPLDIEPLHIRENEPDVRLALQERQLALEFPGAPAVIGILEPDESASGQLQPSVASSPSTDLGRSHELHAVVAEVANHLCSIVGGRVIDHNDFEVSHLLCQHAGD
jgi:hypothetical protein